MRFPSGGPPRGRHMVPRADRLVSRCGYRKLLEVGCSGILAICGSTEQACITCVRDALLWTMISDPAPLEPSSSPTNGEHVRGTPLRTATIHESQCEPWYDGEDAIEALGEYDAPREHELPVIARSFDLGGSSRCAVSVPGRGLSKRHCLLERRGERFLVHDLDSKNGTIHEGRRIREAIDLKPGDRFTAIPITFVALNRAMRMHRQLLIDVLGTDFAPSADKLMIEAAKGLGNLLITGEAGCEQNRLAHAIHAMSLVHDRLPVDCAALPVDRASQLALVTSAKRSTLILTLTEKTRAIDPTFHAMLFSPNYRIRLIVIAPSAAVARRILSRDEVGRMQHIWIRPVAVRVGELPVLLDRLLAERDAPIRHSSLTRANWDGFLRHAWRGNWEELRHAADRLAAIARIPDYEQLTWRQRAAALGIALATLYDWHKSLKLTLPLFA